MASPPKWEAAEHDEKLSEEHIRRQNKPEKAKLFSAT